MTLTKKLNFKLDEVLLPYIAELVNDKVYHSNYQENKEQAEQMGVHLKGDHPAKLLDTYRPNEPVAIQEYRLSIYEPITKSLGKRIVNVLSKIQQSSNYSIKFQKQKNVSDVEGLQNYTEKTFPILGSVTNWAFNVALKEDLIDPNSLVVIKPIIIPDDNVTFLKPFPYIYRSDQVCDYGLNYYTILLDEKNMVKDVALNIWEIITDTQILKVTQTSTTDKGVVDIEVLFEISFGEAPAFFLGGDYREGTIPFAYDSFVSGILPYWNKVIRMDSDLDAQYNQHLFMERVEIEVECDNGCQKSEKLEFNVKLVNGKEVVCKRCNGAGWINGRSPYGVTSVRKDSFDTNGGDQFPGVTYISKPIDIVELTEKKIEGLISMGFAAINMDIIDKVGENQSGVAKTIDRSELESFLSKVSDNLFDNIIYNTYKYISLWRYSVINESVMPTINKPTKFNVLTDLDLAEQMKFLKESGVNSNTIIQLELDLIDKKFPNDEDKKMFNKNIIDLDPMSESTEDEKINILLGGGATREQYIVSSNIRGFILDLMESDPNFLMKPRKEKMAKLLALAKLQITKPIENGDTEQSGETANAENGVNG